VRIMLVEDDHRFADTLGPALRRRGYHITHAPTGAAALAGGECDLVLLDLNLPDLDGLEVCRILRERGDVAIIALTARGDEWDRVGGLRAGADDYVVKPFSLVELQARIDAVLRRSRPRARGELRAGRLAIRLDLCQATWDGLPLPLTRKEMELLTVLIRDAGAVVPRDRLIIEVWRTNWRGAGRTLDVPLRFLSGRWLVEVVRDGGDGLVRESHVVTGPVGSLSIDVPVGPMIVAVYATRVLEKKISVQMEPVTVRSQPPEPPGLASVFVPSMRVPPETIVKSAETPRTWPPPTVTVTFSSKVPG
jgi:DNA-binding response OmpR family regulator